MIAEAGIALVKELFGKVASGEITADQASSQYEMEALKEDTKIALGQQELLKIDAQSDRPIQYMWRPAMNICLCSVTMIWPFASILQTLGLTDLSADQLENLKSISQIFLPYAAVAMGIREAGKLRRQTGLLNKLATLIKK